jgi:molecular chaperone GrpE
MAGGLEEQVTGMSREEIVRRFEAWLDEALTSEEPPRGIEAEILGSITGESSGAEPVASEYALWAAMTALTQEVKLQGRAFKELDATVNAQAARGTEREREVARETERRCRKEFLGVLIDLRDRLARGLESARASEAEVSTPPPRGWRARLFAPPAMTTRPDGVIEALKNGYEMGLERVDETLEEFQARRMICEGQTFDPKRMNAVDREESSSVPAGTVMEVYRSGYEWNGEVFRPAQVKVACAPGGQPHE